MQRKIAILSDGGVDLMSQTPAYNELQLQEIIKKHPDLLPIEDFHMTGPLLVLGKEAQVPSGAIDLVAMARGGEILLVEFKQGPKNSDFRAAIAQLIDYGSDLWKMKFEEFETLIARRFFGSDRCDDQRLKGQLTMQGAARAVWTDISDEEMEALRGVSAKQLETGAFHYVVAAQGFTPSVERSLRYMNATSAAPRYYAVELVRFALDGHHTEVFETRTVVAPDRRGPGDRIDKVDENIFLARIEDETYREIVAQFLDGLGALNVHLNWGTQGVSMRMETPLEGPSVSVGWLFPPGVIGWYGLANLTFGFDTAGAMLQRHPEMRPILDQFASKLATAPGAEHVHSKTLDGYRFGPSTFAQAYGTVLESLTELDSAIEVLT